MKEKLEQIEKTVSAQGAIGFVESRWQGNVTVKIFSVANLPKELPICATLINR